MQNRPFLLSSLSSLLLAMLAVALFQGCRAPSRPAASAYGAAGSAHREPITPAQAKVGWADARAVLENRCVVCHGCYDAPCQLKLGSFEGIDRGGSEAKVYDASRLTESAPTRLFVDAHGAAEWRTKGFHAVLPDVARDSVEPDPAETSVLTRMLDLKRTHPLVATTDVARDFTIDIDRKQTCTDGEHFERYASDHPLWGMPYALPGLNERENASVVDWVKAGAPHDDPAPLPSTTSAAITEWEAFLNDAPLKNRLAARYIYEHLFLASLYFEGTDDPAFFRLVRSRSPLGAVDEIATRRPFDDPKSERVYYRFARRDERSLAKTQIPYALGPARLKLYRQLFLDPDYRVDSLPTYAPDVASNPFRAFEAIPVRSRYRFMLDDAEFTMMGFIKGPVCRGQVALDVIQERFWVVFLDPDVPWMGDEAAFLAGEASDRDLDMPASGGSDALPTLWLGYGRKHDRYVAKKNAFLEAVTRQGHGLSLASIWDGGGTNPNASLTVYRHFDSATVVQGLVGGSPKTAWVVDYPLLERIHYLLVAGFDVFGNVTHQVTSRLYMDFLRMEGEANFLSFLPEGRRKALVDAWYRGVDGASKDRIDAELAGFAGAASVRYRSSTPEEELFAMWETRLGKAAPTGYDLAHVDDARVRSALDRLDHVKGRAASWLPETSFLAIGAGNGDDRYASILRDSAHTNIAEPFREKDRRLKDEDSLSVVRGFLGAYPNELFQVSREDLDGFVDAIAKLDGDPAYRALRARFGVLRTSSAFWPYSDRIDEAYRKQAPRESGLFDYNRLDAF